MNTVAFNKHSGIVSLSHPQMQIPSFPEALSWNTRTAYVTIVPTIYNKNGY